jgi:periplasmic protein TonB
MRIAPLAAPVLVAVSPPMTLAVAQDQQFSPAASQAYISLVYFHLQHFKRYPDSAHGASGGVVVKFALDRDGDVVSSAVQKSSGNEALDQEALAMLQRAKPFPRFPASTPGARAWFAAPIVFSTARNRLGHV